MGAKNSKRWQISVFKYPLSDSKKFTYEADSDQTIQSGEIVKLKFGRQTSLGMVYAPAPASSGESFKVSKIQAVLDIPPLPPHILELANWLADYYAASGMSIWQSLLPAQLERKSRLKPQTNISSDLEKLNKLSPEQQQAFTQINNGKSQKYLLHGITGSGKTEVFLHLIKNCIEHNKSAILLVPEIMLTTQMIDRVCEHFNDVVVMHSGLSSAQRRANWHYILETSAKKPLVVLGARSALFAPLHNLGLIIVDEEHEPSYKQDASPRYLATTVAAQLANNTGAKLVLASATPSITTYFLTKAGKLQLVKLNSRYHPNSSLPDTHLVKLDKPKELITEELKTKLLQTLKEHKQALLFLNLRGSARALICTNCGQAVKCPNCEISLSFHADQARLRCHYCNYTQLPPTTCPSCNQPELNFVGAGVKQLEEELKQLLPHNSVVRIDRDSAKPGFLQQAYRDFRDGKIDVLIGTQMISRGLDIAELHLVGIVNANTSLGVADFSASERTFQLTAQAAGRAGRRERIGEVIIQTYSPDNPAIAAAAKHDYKSFYLQELKTRQQFDYPPFVYLLKLTCARTSDLSAQKAALDFKAQINRSGITLLGPTPAFQKKHDLKYHWQLIVKSKSRPKLVEIAHKLPPGWTADLDPVNLL